ncbi:hypothetical protein GJ496_008285 [Pomphorhynchus laevis]|nr:hypothetical protein GJ496_008285 [Pomphorhynchus laevis]
MDASNSERQSAALDRSCLNTSIPKKERTSVSLSSESQLRSSTLPPNTSKLTVTCFFRSNNIIGYHCCRLLLLNSFHTLGKEEDRMTLLGQAGLIDSASFECTKHRRRERIQPHKSSSAPTKPKSCFPVTQDSHQQ